MSIFTANREKKKKKKERKKERKKLAKKKWRFFPFPFFPTHHPHRQHAIKNTRFNG